MEVDIAVLKLGGWVGAQNIRPSLLNSFATNKQGQAHISLTTSSARLASERPDRLPALGTHAHLRPDFTCCSGLSLQNFPFSSLACSSQGHFRSCQQTHHHTCAMVLHGVFALRPWASCRPENASHIRPTSRMLLRLKVNWLKVGIQHWCCAR